jgi:cytochrome c553
LPFDYIVQQLRDYRSGVRGTALPQRIPQKFMMASSKSLTDEEIKDAATYYSALKPRRNIRVVEAAMVPKVVVANWTWIDPESGVFEAIGKRIVEVPEHLEHFELRDARATFIAYAPPGSLKRGEALVTGKLPERTPACSGCHGPDLKGLTIAPPIAGRSASYAARQLHELKEGLRSGSNAALMKPVLEKLDEDDLLAIVAYLASLSP